MKRFTLIKKSFDSFDGLTDMLKSLLGNSIEIKEYDNNILYYYNSDNNEDVNNLILSYANELLIDVTFYSSSFLEEKLDKELLIAQKLIKNLKAGAYDLKKALFELDIIEDKSQILEFILDGTGIDERFILDFTKADLNVSKASKIMFIHRNTLNYKLDRLKEVSNFDLKVFNDAYILYKLVK